MRFVILTGLSGAGKTTALQALEDLGYYTADNVPPPLWLALITQMRRIQQNRLVIGVDVRTRAHLDTVPEQLAALLAAGITPEVVFLDASDEVLIRRYNLTRRTHPLQSGLSADIYRERQVLGELRAIADVVLDTSQTTARQLTEELWQRFGGERSFRLRLVSFGFKRGVPIDADNVFDLRGMPNPYYQEALRREDGCHPAVQSYVFSPEGLTFYGELRAFVKLLAAQAAASGRNSYTVALGCTGGQHRSVAVAERLMHDLADTFATYAEHRDVAAALAEPGEQGAVS